MVTQFKIVANEQLSYSQNQQQASLMQDIINNNTAHRIDLKKIIESELTFLEEYVKICQAMQLNSYSNLALKIYQTWRCTWG